LPRRLRLLAPPGPKAPGSSCQRTGTLKGISKGEGDLAKRLGIRSRDEIGSLAGGMDEMSRGASDINGAVTSIGSTSRENRETIASLGLELGRFKTRE